MLAGKALVENKCKILQLAVEVLNDLHQQKTKILLKGLTHKAYKPEEKEQKKPEDEMSGKVELVTSQKVRWPEAVAPAVLAAPRCCRCCRSTTSQRGFIFSPIFFPVFKMYTFLKQIYYMFIGKKKISVCRKLSV